MADKFITLHPNNDGVLDNTTNVYPNIKASQNILDDDGNPIPVQEKLTSGVSIKGLRVGSPAASSQTLLGSGDIIIDFLNSLYPIGTIYVCGLRANVVTDTDNNPICPIQKILGGVWQPIYDTFLFAAAKGVHTEDVNDYRPGDEGGSKDAVVVNHKHTLEGTALPAGRHQHTANVSYTFPYDNEGQAGGSDKCLYRGNTSPISGQKWTMSIDVETSFQGPHYHTIQGEALESSDFSDGVGKNMPPYKAVYAWERIS